MPARVGKGLRAHGWLQAETPALPGVLAYLGPDSASAGGSIPRLQSHTEMRNVLILASPRFQIHWLLSTILSISALPAGEPEVVREPARAQSISTRILFGMDRLTPRRWDGAIKVSPGGVLSVDGVHFEGRDTIQDRFRWLLSNRVTRYADSTTPRGYDPVHTRQFAMIPNGITATLEAGEASEVMVETEEGNLSFSMDSLVFGHPRKFFDGLAQAERIPTTVDFTEGAAYNDYPVLAADRRGGLWMSWISYSEERDAVWIARNEGEAWGPPVRISPPEYGDNFRTSVEVGPNGDPVVVWSGKGPDGQWGLFSRAMAGDSLAPVSSIASHGENIYHRTTTDGAGNTHVVWQGFRNQVSRILHARLDGSGWSPETVVSIGEADDWAPAAAATSDGSVWVAWDGYLAGDFNIYLRRLAPNGQWQEPIRVTSSPGFDANVSLAAGANGRLWIAWDHGEANWGKDWSSQRFRPGGGAGLYRLRSVKVAVLEGGRLRLAPDIMAAVPDAYRDYVQQARLAVDARGHVWVMARSLTSVTTRVNNNWGAGGIWEMLLTRLDGEGWLPAVKLHGTNGRNDVWAASTVDSRGRLWFAWSRDARPFGSPLRAVNRPTPSAQTTQVSYTVIDPSHPAWMGSGQPPLEPFTEASVAAVPVHPNEVQDTEAIRSYRYTVGSRTYRVLRGDLHRHTDISSDGIGEGGLIDFYRYALTAGQYDFMMVGDHQYGGDSVPGVEYNWWRTEKSEDLFGIQDRFWPLYGTERSLPYPNGHRNTVFAQRGVRWMPIQADERRGLINTGEILFPYLRRNGGISTPHTSGSDQGTDWRESDPEIEPVVEIYQSLHASYEYPGAPRAETPDKRYYHHGEPWRPDGFVWEAWAKGIKIGVQASSDHVGTHDSYACVLVPADRPVTRQDLIDAMKLRHTYAATDNIILDVRMGDHIMGDAFQTTRRPALTVRAHGTGPIKRVVVIKDNAIVFTATPEGKDADLEYRDDTAAPGESYYYVRVEQNDGSLAWSSPIWVTYR